MRASSHAARVARLRQQLSQRERDVLVSLYRVRLLSLRHLQRLFVVDGSPQARTRRAQMLLKKLHDLGLVVRLDRVIGGARAGSAGYLYGLSGLGQAVLDIRGPNGGRRRRIWEARPYFQDHMLAVAELYVQVVERHRAGYVQLLEFDAEPSCWRRYAGPGGEAITLKPDVFLRLGIGAVERSVFVEADLGTESLPTIRRKCQRFIEYWRSGTEQRWRGVFPKVVWLVPNEHRQANIAGVIQKLGREAQALFDVGLLAAGTTLLMQPNQGAAA